MNMKKVQQGFTLIELMIVVAIIGILAAVAIPAYQDYVVKSKLATVQTSLDSIKTAASLYYQENGSFPSTASSWTTLGIATPTLPATISTLTMTATTGALVATLQAIKSASPAINGTTLTFTPSQTSNQTVMTWAVTCTSTDLVLKKYFGC